MIPCKKKFCLQKIYFSGFWAGVYLPGIIKIKIILESLLESLAMPVEKCFFEVGKKGFRKGSYRVLSEVKIVGVDDVFAGPGDKVIDEVVRGTIEKIIPDLEAAAGGVGGAEKFVVRKGKQAVRVFLRI